MLYLCLSSSETNPEYLTKIVEVLITSECHESQTAPAPAPGKIMSLA